MLFDHHALRSALHSAMVLFLARMTRQFAVDGPPPRPSDGMLLIRPDHLGDVLFATPALRRLRRSLPHISPTLMVGPWSTAVATRISTVADTISCDFPWFNGRRATNVLLPYVLLFRTARQLHARRFGAAVNLRFDFWWGAALAALAGIPFRAGYATRDCLPFLNATTPYRARRHEVVQNAALIDLLVAAVNGTAGGSCDEQELGALEFPLYPEERTFAANYLAQHGIRDGEALVAIHPGTRAPIKRWGEERFAAVATALGDRLRAVVLLTGSRSERPIGEAIARQTTASTVIAAGDTTVGQLGALLERAAIVVGVDSGPLHLAVALDRPTVHLFGPSDHIAFGPYGDPARHAVVRAGIPCSPCHRLDWPVAQLAEHECMSAIEVEQVVRAANQVLDRPQDKRLA